MHYKRAVQSLNSRPLCRFSTLLRSAALSFLLVSSTGISSAKEAAFSNESQTKTPSEYQAQAHHLDAEGKPLYTNRLLNESSLYLKQHAHNPVQWWPWGEEAFAEARKQDKPVLLSIGYSTCHWCHVMARESFEDLQIAQFINQHFIAIKVDREEHPDIDEVYLTAVQMLSGKAGWPLTAVLTPKGQPFFGGTYFSPQQFRPLLGKISNAWSQNRDAVTEQAERLHTALTNINKSNDAAKAISTAVIKEAQLRIQADLQAPPASAGSTFPREPELLFLLNQVFDTLDKQTLTVAIERLKTLAAGGIHDQIGGGFHRYSVKSDWKIPHFEKMQYNQAQLGQLYAMAYQLTGDPLMLEVAESTFDFLLTEMQAPDGGFYSAMDAESEGQEGAFYTWSYAELKSLLSRKELKALESQFSVSPEGNFKQRNVLHRLNADTAKTPKQALLSKIKRKLSLARATRPRPHTDTKIISSWNAMSISALVSGFHASGREEYLSSAIQAAELLWSKSYDKKAGLSRTLPTEDGKRVPATLEDYAYLSKAFIDLYDQTNHPDWLMRSEQLAQEMIQHFYDNQSGGFLISSAKADKGLIVALVTARDDAVISGNSMAAILLSKLYRRTGTLEYRQKARSVLAKFSQRLLANPESISGMLIAASHLGQGETGPIQHTAKGKVRVSTNIDTAKGSEQLSVDISIQPGWHINAATVLDEALIPTLLEQDEAQCIALSSINYPQGQRVSLGFQKDELMVYEGELEIQAAITSPKQTTLADCAVVSARLRVQACSDEVCLAPETLQLRVPFR